MAGGLLLTCAAGAQEAGSTPDGGDELAKKLANPVASLISVPTKWSWDTGIGALDTDRNSFVVQPVIPLSLGARQNLIVRTIVSYVDADATVSGGGGVDGFGDVLQSFFFSPKAPTAGGWIWGAGPALNYPTASEDSLGSGQWSAGPTFVLLKQDHGWTYGALANHLWSVAGEDDRAHTSASFVQPFLSFTTSRRTTYSVNTESAYDWRAGEWTVPLNASVSQLLKIGKRPFSVGFTTRAYANRPSGGPDWGVSVTWTLLYPK